MNTAQFFTKWLDKENDNGSIKGQCVNLIHSYHEEVLGIPRFIGNAIDYKPTQLFKGSRPMPGDVIVFNYGKDGHIGICVWARSMDFECMEQNNPIGSPCHYVYHTDFNKIASIWRPHLLENYIPRPQPVSNSYKFTASYTCFNADPNLMEQARKLLNTLSNGKLDCTFTYQQLPPIYSPTELYTQDNQFKFLQAHPVTTPFVFLTFVSQTNWVNMVTSEVPGTKTILTAANPNGSALNVAFEFTHAIDKYLQSHGVQIEDTDIYTPDQNFLQKKINLIVENLVLLKS